VRWNSNGQILSDHHCHQHRSGAGHRRAGHSFLMEFRVLLQMPQGIPRTRIEPFE
jgi:hypothetical protein